MKNVYFENKVITFTSNNSKVSGNFTLIEGEIPKWEDILVTFNSCDHVVVVGDIEESIAKFSSQFREITAAGGVVKRDDDMMLMIFRHSRWDLPKGKIEVGESVEECAVREVEEECGITPLELQEKICSTFHIYPIGEEWIIKESHWFNMGYHGSQEPTPQVEEDITAAMWISKEQFLENSKESYFTIKDVIDTREKML